MKRGKDNPGNTLSSQRSFDLAMIANGVLLSRAESYIAAYAEEDTFVQSVTLKIPQDVGQDTFVIIRAMVGGKPMVAFHGAPEFGDAIIGLTKRMQNRSLRWKEDMYAD